MLRPSRHEPIPATSSTAEAASVPRTIRHHCRRASRLRFDRSRASTVVNVDRAESGNPAAASAAGLAGAGWWVVSMANVVACGSGGCLATTSSACRSGRRPVMGWVAASVWSCCRGFAAEAISPSSRVTIAAVAGRLAGDLSSSRSSSSSSAAGTPGTSVASRGGRCRRCCWITSSRPRPWNGGSPVIIANITRPTQ